MSGQFYLPKTKPGVLLLLQLLLFGAYEKTA